MADLKPYLVTPEQPTFNQLIYGDSDAGKTTYGSTAQDHPDMRNVLFANIEGGLMSVMHRKDIHAVDIKESSELVTLGWALAGGDYPSVNTLVVDNITELLTMNLREQVQRSIDSGKNMVRNRQRTLDDVWQEDYGKATLQLSAVFRFLRDLPIHVIFTAHKKLIYPKMPEGTDMSNVEPLLIRPDLNEKLVKMTMTYMDFVWCLEKDQETGKRFAITTSRGLYLCKTRGPKFLKAIGDAVEEPTLPAVYDTFVRTSHRRKKTQPKGVR